MVLKYAKLHSTETKQSALNAGRQVTSERGSHHLKYVALT